jgi:hypothetical protein
VHSSARRSRVLLACLRSALVLPACLRAALVAALATMIAGCAPAATPRTPPVSLLGSDGRAYSLRASPIVVLVFFSPSCAYQNAHDARLAALSAFYAHRGVSFFAVDSESTGSPAQDQAEAARRHYPFPILRDEGARVARALHAEYATASVVARGDGHVFYTGAIDSDGIYLHDDAHLYLRAAIEAALAGHEPEVTHTEAPGCALTLW